MLVYRQRRDNEHISMDSYLKIKSFRSENTFENVVYRMAAALFLLPNSKYAKYVSSCT